MDQKFAAYVGSMTTPACTEGVDWLVFLSPLNISSTQLAVFPSFHNYQGRKISHNYRNVQRGYNRTVKIYY